MKFVHRKATTAKSKYTVENFAEVEKAFLQEVVSVVTVEEQLNLSLIGTRLALNLCRLLPGQWIIEEPRELSWWVLMINNR